MCVPRSVSCHNQIAGAPPILVHFSKGCYTSLHTFLIRLGREDFSVQSMMFARFRSSIGSPTPICMLPLPTLSHHHAKEYDLLLSGSGKAEGAVVLGHKGCKGKAFVARGGTSQQWGGEEILRSV